MQQRTDTPLIVANAGLVLVSPFLPQFFTRLGLLSGDGRDTGIASGDALDRAAGFLQYLAVGDSEAAVFEPALNKLLCGADVDADLAGPIDPTAEERAICDQLLAAILVRWTALANSSFEALRETFLQRQGQLSRGDAGWTLTVARKTLDIVIDEIPWSVSPIRHDWMREPIEVVWR